MFKPLNKDFNFFLICHHSINSDCNFDVKADTLALPWVIAGLQQEGVLSEQEVKLISRFFLPVTCLCQKVEKVKGEGGKLVVVLASKGSPALRGLCR